MKFMNGHPLRQYLSTEIPHRKIFEALGDLVSRSRLVQAFRILGASDSKSLIILFSRRSRICSVLHSSVSQLLITVVVEECPTLNHPAAIASCVTNFAIEYVLNGLQASGAQCFAMMEQITAINRTVLTKPINLSKIMVGQWFRRFRVASAAAFPRRNASANSLDELQACQGQPRGWRLTTSKDMSLEAFVSVRCFGEHHPLHLMYQIEAVGTSSHRR